MTAKEYAREAFEKIKNKLEPNATIPLADYRCLNDFYRVVPDQERGLGFFHHRNEVTALGELIMQRANAVPMFVQIDPTEYFQWLEKRENTTQARAAFVGWIAAGRPKNYNSIGGETEL